MHAKWFVVLSALVLSACDGAARSCERRLNSMDTSALTEREYDGPMDESAEGAAIVHGFDANQTLRRVAVTFYGGRGRREIVYTIADPEAFTMTVNDVAYAQAISADRPTEGGSVTTTRFAVCDGNVVSRPATGEASELAAFIDRLPEFRGIH